MVDWLPLFLRVGGIGAAFMVGLYVMGKWLLKQIDTALTSYLTTYSQQQASIDARIANLEQLAREQAHLTRTVESIKDDIAAQAKTRDNRWTFRKDVYTNLIRVTSHLIGHWVKKKGLERMDKSRDRTAPEALRLLDEMMESNVKEFQDTTKEFITWANLAPLATAESVKPAIQTVMSMIGTRIDFRSPTSEAQMDQKIDALNDLLRQLQLAGRKELWETPVPASS